MKAEEVEAAKDGMESEAGGSNQRGMSVVDLGHFGCGTWRSVKAHFISGRTLRYLGTLIRNIFSCYQLLYLNIASWLWGALSKL